MKYLILVVLVFLTLFVNHRANAQVATTPTFFCVGTNLQPPCATIPPTHIISGAPSTAPTTQNITVNPTTQTSQIPTISAVPTSPCVTSQSQNVHTFATNEKVHFSLPPGLIKRLIEFLLQLILKLLQQLGIGNGPHPNPHPTPIPTQHPVPTTGPSGNPTGNPTGAPTTNPSINPCPSATSAVTTAPTNIPSFGVSPTSGSNPTPTVFGVSPTPSTSPTVANCQPNAILVNPCRPWFGAAAKGNPNAASDALSQFTYFEQITGRSMDIFHDYHSAGNLPLNSDEIHFAKRPNTYSFVNWKPAGNWADAGGGNAAVNANIDKTAANIKAIAPTKIFLTVWHEPENDVTPGTSTCPNLKGGAGSPAQYIAMWQNVRNRFNAAGVTNVVWVMVYQGYQPFDCLKPQMWPGNSLVDWVAYDTYGTDAKPNWNDSVGRIYKLLQADQSPTTDFASKPWAVGEYGTCNMTNAQNSYTYYQSAKAAIDANTYPNLKMYMVYADTGNNAGPGCLTNFTKAGAADPTKQTNFNQFANDPVFTATH